MTKNWESRKICVHIGHGKLGKSWKFGISFSRPGTSWNLILGPGKSWKITFMFGILVTANAKDKVQ